MNTNIKFPNTYDAFPKFPQEHIPNALPSDFGDVSFDGDACPSFSNGVALIFINWPQMMRTDDMSDYNFTVVKVNSDFEIDDSYGPFDTNDIHEAIEVVAHIEEAN